MAITETTGLIIKEQKVSESDRLVTVLTKEMGLIRAFVPNALKLKSKNITATQLLSYSGMQIYHSRDTYKINEAKSIEVFFGLRNDISALAVASYFCELLMQLAPVAENAENYLKLVLNCLYLLCKKSVPIDIVKAVFEMKIAQFSGYCPDLEQCAKCKETQIENVSFDIIGGVVTCESCSPQNSYKIPNSVFAALRHIIYCENSKLFSFRLNDESTRILSDVCEKFLIAQTERNYKTLDFYKQMRF